VLTIPNAVSSACSFGLVAAVAVALPACHKILGYEVMRVESDGAVADLTGGDQPDRGPTDGPLVPVADASQVSGDGPPRPSIEASVAPVFDMGGPCGPSSCSFGCCRPTGACHPGTAGQVCGSGGLPCADCTALGWACINQVCQDGCGPGTCYGCCDGNTCIKSAQMNASRCGISGAQCVACPAGYLCQNSMCWCDPATCVGCCYTKNCHPGNEDMYCGTGGETCDVCTLKGEVCNLNSFTCQP
jgi:hypothetical protein